MAPRLRPVFSHGSSGVEGWPSVLGRALGSGNPIEVHHSSGLNWPRIQLSYFGTPDMTVVTEINPGPLDEVTGYPDPNHWLEIGSDVIAAAGSKSYSLPPDAMYVRTRISVYATGTLESMVPVLELPTGQKVQAQYPMLRKGGPV